MQNISTVIPAQAGIHCFMYSLFIGLPRLRRAMTKVYKNQVQEATRTQWIPAVAGMTTVFIIFISLCTVIPAQCFIFMVPIPACAGMTNFLYFTSQASSYRRRPVSIVSFILFLYSQTGLPRLRRAMTGVCNGQVQEATRTQWIPAVAGMTTAFKFYLLST